MIRWKILRYYFVGEFDMTPIHEIPLSIIPYLISVIGGDESQRNTTAYIQDERELCNLRQNAIFRMLKELPMIFEEHHEGLKAIP